MGSDSKGKIPSDVYSMADVLTPNETEAYVLTGIEIEDVESAGKAADLIVERGTPMVAIKMGGHGAYYASPNDSGYIPAFDLKVVDTVGAGDAFAAALVVALSEGKGLFDAVLYGSAAGGKAVTKAELKRRCPLDTRSTRFYLLPEWKFSWAPIPTRPV